MGRVQTNSVQQVVSDAEFGLWGSRGGRHEGPGGYVMARRVVLERRTIEGDSPVFAVIR